VAVASAGLYASVHLVPDRQPCQHTTTQAEGTTTAKSNSLNATIPSDNQLAQNKIPEITHAVQNFAIQPNTTTTQMFKAIIHINF